MKIVYMIKVKVNMYKINVTLNSSSSITYTTYNLPVYRQQTEDEKATQYATYHSGYFNMDSDKKKIIYDHYYHYYRSHLSNNENDEKDYEKDYENEKNDYIQSHLLEKIKKSSNETLITKQIVTNFKYSDNEINVSVDITPITHLNLSCVDVSEYLNESLKRRSIDHTNQKIVWVNKVDGEWELFTCAMSTGTNYKITISTSKNRNNFLSDLTELAQHRLDYISDIENL